MMKNSGKTLALTLLFLLWTHSFLPACSCGPYVQIFCEAVNHHFQIAVVEMTENLSPSLKKAHLITDLSESIDRDSIYIIGQDGLNCGIDLNLFSVGDTLLAALGKWDNDSTYILGACGLNYLQFARDSVFGPIYEGVDKQSFADFTAGLQECILLVDVPGRHIDPAQVSLFPNPSRGRFTLESSAGPMTGISVFHTSGRLLVEKKMPAATTYFRMDLSHLPPGIYITRVLTDLGFTTKKIVLL